jgi:hypothetical protein
MTSLTILNGRMPDRLLVTVDVGDQLRTDAAASYQRARDAGMPAGITSAYRTEAQQAPLYARYLNDLRTGRKPPRLAAKPGTSFHGEGTALDLPIAAELWLRAHPEYGWRFTIKSERWHAEYDPARDRSQSLPAPDASHGVTTHDREDEDMLLIKSSKYGVYLLRGSKMTGLGSQASVDAIAGAGVGVAWVEDSADMLRLIRSSESTFVLYNPPQQGGRGYAVWQGGKATGIGSQQLVDSFLATGATLLTLDAGDFERFSS